VCEQVFKVNKKSKDSPYSIAERKVPELMCRFLAVSLQVMRVINPAVGCHLCLQCFDAVGWAAGRASGL